MTPNRAIGRWRHKSQTRHTKRCHPPLASTKELMRLRRAWLGMSLTGCSNAWLVMGLDACMHMHMRKSSPGQPLCAKVGRPLPFHGSTGNGVRPSLDMRLHEAKAWHASTANAVSFLITCPCYPTGRYTYRPSVTLIVNKLPFLSLSRSLLSLSFSLMRGRERGRTLRRSHCEIAFASYVCPSGHIMGFRINSLQRKQR